MLEACGWRVLKVSVKDGPDLIAAKTRQFRNNEVLLVLPRTVAIEVKTGKGKLRKGQAAWLESWPGETAVIRDIEQVKEL